MKIFSYGGGVQSNAVLVLQAQGKLDYEAFLFANVGEKSENPDTLAYVHDVAMPYAEQHGIKMVELRKIYKGQPIDLYDYAWNAPRSVPLPVRLSTGAFGNRTCTVNFKINVIRSWLYEKTRARANSHIIGLGISIDEYYRMKKSRPNEPVREYPLIDLRLTRYDCQKIILDAGLPIPPKSACYFCPFQPVARWTKLKASRADLFDAAADLEDRLNEKRDTIGRDTVYLHPALLPLRIAVGEQWILLDEMSNCESGFCFT